MSLPQAVTEATLHMPHGDLRSPTPHAPHYEQSVPYYYAVLLYYFAGMLMSFTSLFMYSRFSGDVTIMLAHIAHTHRVSLR